MSLYPSLEDMKVDHMAQAQAQFNQQAHQAIASSQAQPEGSSYAALYPSLSDWMGLDLNSSDISSAYPQQQSDQSQAVATRQAGTVSNYVAPISGSSAGVKKAEIKQGVREVIVCKGEKGKVGLRFQAVSKGIFISFVGTNTPAALGGLRFGDQILQVDGQNVAGWSRNKMMDVVKKCDPKRIIFAIRDRPFERTITLQKDSSGYIGFVYNKGKVTAIGKDSSAARNGLLIDHALLEIDGQNVIGIKDKKIGEVIQSAGGTVTITLMPNFVFDHMIKSMSTSLVKKEMDHSIPDI